MHAKLEIMKVSSTMGGNWEVLGLLDGFQIKILLLFFWYFQIASYYTHII